MAVLTTGVVVAVGTPTEDGRIKDYILIPPPGNNRVGQWLYWNPETLMPEWRVFEEIVTIPPPVSGYAPLVNNEGKWLVDNLGRRLVGLPLAA